MGRRRGASVAAGFLVLALAGTGACSGDDDGGDDQGAPDTTAGPDDGTGACALLTGEEVGELFGTAAETATPPGAAGTTCLWQAATEAGAAPSHQLQLSVYTGEPLDPSSFGEGAQPVEGLGDEAFVIPQGNLGTVAGVQDGDRGIVVVYATLGDPAGRAAQSDAVIGLLRTAAGRAEG
jgi:hypothetical protein